MSKNKLLWISTIKLLVHTLTTTIAIMLSLSYIQFYLASTLEPLPADNSLVLLGDLLSQLLILAILAMPFLSIGYLVLRWLFSKNWIEPSIPIYLLANSLAIGIVLIIRNIPQIGGLYVLYIFFSLQYIALRFYWFALVYLILLFLHKVRHMPKE